MAYAFASTRLHVANSAEVTAIESVGTVGSAVEVLIGLDYAYNVGAVAELYDDGYPLDIPAVLKLLRRARNSGVLIIDFALRAMVPEEAQLQLKQIEIGSSFTITISGLAESITTIASLFDPSQRSERLRHQKVMNRVAEERAFSDLARDRFNAMPMIAENQSNFNQRLAGNLGPDRAELKMLMAKAYGQAARSLRSHEIETVALESAD